MGKPQRLNELIDNDNERFQRNHSMTMSMKRVYGVRQEKLDERIVDERAECLVQTLGQPASKPLYCDAVRYLERSFINEKLEYSLKHGRKPAACFGAIIYRQLLKAGVYPKPANSGNNSRF